MPESRKPKILSKNLFPVVGVGASAGGLDAFKKLLKAIPEDSGMAFILVQHLDPSHESILTELLQKATRIPVSEITDNVKVEPDHIYIIPANKILNATDGILQLSSRPPNKRNMAIDILFTSLADVHQSHAIGVVLSGTGTDGTLGLKAIKEQGGVAFVQEQQSASYNEMPQSAVDAGVADFILPPDKIPAQLVVLKNALGITDDSEERDREHMQTNEFRQVFSLLRSRKSVDFTFYKQSTIRRRITRRIALSMKENLSDYLSYVKENPTELDILYQDLLIPVTQFFRDPKVFDYLCASVFPGLLKDKPLSEPLRVWVAGCSTGEEVYSMAMCLHEYLTKEGKNYKIQVFATDISDQAILKARAGCYKDSEMTGISEARLQQFFTRAEDKFCINKFIRDCCVFAYHNYLKDPPFARIDLISCRNSLIYLEPFLQKNALTTFHYSLKEKGILVLGKSETTGPASVLFNIVDKNNKIYSKKGKRGKFLHALSDGSDQNTKPFISGTRKKEIIKDDFQKAADDFLLQKFAPPGVVINNEMDIVQFRGTTGMWLEASPGKPNLNVVKMARDGLAFELRNAVHKAQKTRQPVIKEDIPFQFMGAERLVTIEVNPLLHTIELHLLILFRDVSLIPSGMDIRLTNPASLVPSKQQMRDKIVIEKLGKELALAREDMRGITEDQEASNEELQSANEELLSGSEELQSLNEELETSKEEIQTSNEELIVVNHELYERNELLNLSRIYAESIVSTIREPLVILSKDLKVRSANKAYYTKFVTTEEATLNKGFFELANRQWEEPGLKKILESVLQQRKNIEDYEITRNFPGLGERVMLLSISGILRDNSEDQSILVAIEDITEKRKVEDEQRSFSLELERNVVERTADLNEANENLKHSNADLQQFAFIASHDLQEPLRKIRTFASMLEERHDFALSETARELVTKISLSSARMSNLVRDVLNFSKIIHDEAIKEETDLNAIVHKIRDDFDLLIHEKKAVIVCEQLPVIEAVASQMDMLFSNLISNALKFSKPEVPPFITITSRSLPWIELEGKAIFKPSLSYVEISFQDNGIGLDQQFEDKIFSIFKRLHTQRKYAGTGIGLAACKKIVQNHHGQISVVSKEGMGASFQVILPVKY